MFMKHVNLANFCRLTKILASRMRIVKAITNNFCMTHTFGMIVKLIMAGQYKAKVVRYSSEFVGLFKPSEVHMPVRVI